MKLLAPFPVLDDVEPLLDLAAEAFVVEVSAQEDGLHGPTQLLQGLIGGMLQVVAGESTQNILRLGCPHAQRRGVLDHLVVLLADQIPVDRPRVRIACSFG
jgi:hypothetical protein